MNTAQNIAEILGGLAKTNPVAIAAIAQQGDWPALARMEQTRRAARPLELLDDGELAAVANGEIDFQALCKQAAAGQKGAR